MHEQLWLMFQHSIQAALQPVFFRYRKILPQQGWVKRKAFRLAHLSYESVERVGRRDATTLSSRRWCADSARDHNYGKRFRRM
jgi:hypothetical protein